MPLERKVLLKYRGREMSEEDASFIRELIARHPCASRRRLSTLLCQAWGWRQPNGTLSDILARGLMLALHRAGHITLPPPRCMAANNIVRRRQPALVALDTSPINIPLAELQPLEFIQVRRTHYEALFDSLIHRYHYLGYTRPVGEHLKYLVIGRAGRPLAALALSSAPRHLGPRDRFIGWSAQARRANIRLVAYNPRFLILPWVRVPHLASHVLSRITRGLAADWQRVYGHPVHFVETFVDSMRFKGICYRAANWVHLGRTTGRGKDDQTHKQNRPIKDVLGYPLVRQFRELLCRMP
ncbi:MAG: DUF4338 domain-containing protein [Elusimicrobia bacterium]|nr:DUF4338 domain-containing protein [Elusimicrobiota bacterium]